MISFRTLTVLWLVTSTISVHAQTTVEDVRLGVRSTYAGVADICFTLVRTSRHDDSYKVSLHLIGEPRWRCWRWRFQHHAGEDSLAFVHSFVDQTYRVLQSDGLGGISPRHESSAYMSQAKIYLSNTGLAPLTRGGLADSWTKFVNDPEIRVRDSEADPGVVMVEHPRFSARLDATRHFVPIRVTWFAAQNRQVLSDVHLEEYREVGGFWIAHRLRDPVQDFEESVSDVRIKQGTDCDQLVVRFPYGTSILRESGQTEVFGEGSLTEAEERLQNWVSADALFDRPAAQVGPLEPTIAVTVPPADVRWVILLWALVICVACATVVVRGRFRVGRTLAAAGMVLSCATRASGESPTPELDLRSQACACYVVETVYGRTASLAGILDGLRGAGELPGLEKLEARLQAQGLHTAIVSLSVTELCKWPYPAIVPLRSAQHPEYP